MQEGVQEGVEQGVAQGFFEGQVHATLELLNLKFQLSTYDRQAMKGLLKPMSREMVAQAFQQAVAVQAP